MSDTHDIFPKKGFHNPTMADVHYYDGHNEDIDTEEEGGEAKHNNKVYQVPPPYTHII